MNKEKGGSLEMFWITYKHRPGSLVVRILVLLSAIITVGVLFSLIVYILVNGVVNIEPRLFEWEFNTDNMSMMPAIVSTVYITFLSLLMAVPVGIFSAIYLVEYAKRGSRLVKVIRTTTETLQGIPSIVYGLFGYILFVITLGWSYSLLAGAVTLAIMILPLIIRTTEEALISVPDSYREGSFGLGAGKLRTVFRIILPCAVPGRSARLYPRHRQNSGRKCGVDIHRGNGGTGSGQSFRICENAVGTHVCIAFRRSLYRRSIRYGCSAAGAGNTDKCAFGIHSEEISDEVVIWINIR